MSDYKAKALEIKQKYTEAVLADAIERETADWAEFFKSDQLEARRAVHRANLAVGYLGSLAPYL
jgi:hypothetical protein